MIDRNSAVTGVAVIIVNYNAADLAIAAVESVLASDVADLDLSVHLIDNASPCGDADVLTRAAEDRGWGRSVTLYLQSVNHGFGRGNNIALEAVSRLENPPEFVFLLNPDAQLEPDTLQALSTFMETRPRAAMLGTRACNPGDPTPITAAFRFPGVASTFSAALNFGPVARLLRRWQVALPADLPTRRVDWVSGAGVMARRAICEKLGFFDPEYFLYFEEVDLMLRTQRAGWECWHVAEARIVHVEGASTEVRGAHRGPQRKPAYWYHSWQYYFAKNHGRAYALTVAMAWIAGAALNQPIARLRGQTPAAPRCFFRDFWAHALRPLLGLRPGRADNAA